MRIPDDDKELFENLDEQRRRINDEFNLLVQKLREGSVPDSDKARLQAQQFHARHEDIIRRMIELLIY